MQSLSRTVSDGVTAALRAAIVEGFYLPGDRLTLRELADRFEVSPTPVRTALVNLANEGLVTNEPHRGSSVTVLSAFEIEDIFDVRARLEGLAARHSVARLSKQDINDLRGLATRFEKATHLPELVATNNHFHVQLYSACERPYLLNLIRTSRLRVQHYMRWYINDATQFEEAKREHHEIVDLAAAGDAELVGQLIEGHVRAVIPYLVEGAQDDQSDSSIGAREAWRSINPRGAGAHVHRRSAESYEESIQVASDDNIYP